jgi:hypothetical protein
MALVLKKWHASRTPDANGNYVHLVGRQPGLLAWILSKLGIDPTTEIEVKDDIVIFSSGSLAGRETRVIPLRNVCSSYYAYEKPWKEALVIGIVLFPFLMIGLIAGPLFYWLNKTLSVGVIESSSWVGGFSFKRSVIEGKNIQEAEAYEVIDIIRHLIEKQTT